MSKNKEPLIVDGINVSKCCYVIDYDPPEWQGTWGGAIHKGACRVYSKDCKDNPNCYFKQLARKTQECEKLSILAQEESARNGYVEYELNDKLKQKTQEYENLKAEEKYLKQCCEKAGKELAKHSFEYDGKEKNLVVQAMELNEKYEKLKKALEEIENLMQTVSDADECSYGISIVVIVIVTTLAPLKLKD